MLQLQEVKKIYKTNGGEVHALNGVSLTFPDTGLVFITGKSGCGKTTLLNVIGGLDGIDGGEIFVQDKKFSAFTPSEYDSYRNTFIGFIFQEYNLLPEFTVEKNIKIAMELQGRQADGEEFEKLLKDVGIEEFKNRTPAELSGGQRQRVAIARALVKQPRIIMADEPTGALDSDTGVQVLDTLKKLSKDTLVIVVSHDREFAEKYADRIIHLVDGQVAQDVTFTEKEMNSNVSEQGDTLVVRKGSDLTEEEKNAVAKAVKERKNIEIVENVCFRDKEPTGAVERKEEEPVALKKSQMKVRSAVQLGVKSLAVKPVRLILTVLISAIAFAVFALFDTIAHFSTASVLKNQLETAFSPTLVTRSDYISDYEAGDRYDVKVSQAVVDELQSKTGGKVKGIFDLYDNTSGEVRHSLSISELLSSSASIGKNYYSKMINGFVEFDFATEIANDKIKEFGYTIVAGEYPTLKKQDGLYQIAISTYLADSIKYYLNGSQLNEKDIDSREDFIGATITVNGQSYAITGLIDCGAIPEKYGVLATSAPYNEETYALARDFTSFIDSGAYKCLFTAQGFLQAVKAEKKTADIFQIGNVEWSLDVENASTKKLVTGHAYCSDHYGEDNILLFDENYPSSGVLTLADDEVLIHPHNLEILFLSQISTLSATERSDVTTKIRNLPRGSKDGNRRNLRSVFKTLGVTLANGEVKATVYQRTKQTNEQSQKEVKIVGVYFGVNADASLNRYKLMMNKNLMRSLGVFAEQGDYSKLLFSAQSIRKGSDAIIDGLLQKEGHTLNWYNNSVLNIILTNETMIRQVADLFLYAALALSVFSIFMLYNYISTSIASKKQSVGVLRALGAGGKDILYTFLSESLIIAVINGILSNIFGVLGCSLVNSYIVEIMNISVHFALFGVRQILIILAISLLTAIVSSSAPIVKISKKKPIELIRRP